MSKRISKTYPISGGMGLSGPLEGAWRDASSRPGDLEPKKVSGGLM